MKRTAVLFLCFLLILGGCSPKVFSSTSFAMDTVVSVQFEGGNKKILNQVDEEVYRLGKLLDARSIPENIDDPEVQEIIGRCLEISKKTDGAFDITVAPYVTLWGFDDKNFHVPTDSAIRAVKSDVGYPRLVSAEGKYAVPKGGGITFGAVAKGYAADRIYDILDQGGVKKAVISLGGNVLLKGDNDGKSWAVGIESPRGDGSHSAVLSLADCMAVTSGGYHRNFTRDGKTYHHIIDPNTGYPAESGLLSVTVISHSGLEADALSTALFVMGKEEALDFWRDGGMEFEAVLITDQREIIATEGLDGKIDQVEEGLKLSIVKK